MNPIAALARRDATAIYRDRFMLLLAFYTLAMALIARLVVGWVPVAHFDLYIAPTIVLMGAMLLGTLLGFSLVEEREQGTWLLLRVLPVGTATLFGYLSATSATAAFVVSLAAAWLYGHPVADWPYFLLMVAVTSLAAPLVMLILAALSTNKIEAMAVSKILSSSGLFAAALFVAPPRWQLVAAWCPWYWHYVGLLRAFHAEPSRLPAVMWPGFPAWLPPTASLALSAAGIAWFIRIYTRRAT